MAKNETLEKIRKKLVGNKKLSRTKAIKLYCKESCCAGNNKSWQDCQAFDCFLWCFRKGREIPENKRITRFSSG